MRQDCVSVIKVCFFLIYIALKDLVNFCEHLLILEANIELCQVIADPDTIPRPRLFDLIDNLVALFDHILHLGLSSFLSSAPTNTYWSYA